MYIEFIKLRLKLVCQIKPKEVLAIVEMMVKGRNKGEKKDSEKNIGDFYPIEDCL